LINGSAEKKRQNKKSPARESVKDEGAELQERAKEPKERNARPHVLRDRGRELKYRRNKHAMRRVTEAEPKPVLDASAKEKGVQESPNANGERDVERPTNSFANLNVMHPLLRALEAKSFLVPTRIQAKTIPLAIRGHNVRSPLAFHSFGLVWFI
jgi:hypothetical protein